MNRRLAFLLAILAQLGFLGWMVAAQERVRSSALRIVLAIEPFDPIDPLSGRYLSINVKASRVDLMLARPGQEPEVVEQMAEGLVGSDVAVILAQEGNRWVARDAVAAEQHEPGRGGVILRGFARQRVGTTLVVDYGLDRFFIPADAADPSSLLWQQGHELAIVVRVDRYGASSTEDLLVDGEPFTRWNARQPR